MKTWSPRHRALALVALLLAALASCAWLFVVRPLRQGVEETAAALVEKRNSLRKRGWPLEPDHLASLLADRRRVLEGDGQRGDPGLTARSEQVLARATAMFRERVRKQFGTDETFLRNASNIDFQEALDALRRRCLAENIRLAPEVLNLSDETSTPYTYQLLLQVWTVDRLVDLVLDHRLRVGTDPGIRARAGDHEHPAAKIRVQQIKAYYTDSDSRQPYALEVPVQMTLRGEMGDVRRFLLALVTAPDFLPPVRFEFYAADPAEAGRGSGIEAQAAEVLLDVTCSAFFAFPQGGAQARDPGKPAAGSPGV